MGDVEARSGAGDRTVLTGGPCAPWKRRNPEKQR